MTTTSAPTRSLVVPAVLTAALAGGLVAIQGRFNGDLSTAGAGPVVAGWLSYVGTAVTTALVVVVRGRGPAVARILRHDARWWWYAVGLCSVPIVIAFAVGIPIVGVAIASVCSVAGQTVAGLGLDARGVGVPGRLRLTGRRSAAALVAFAGLAVAVWSGAGGTAAGTMAAAVGLGAFLFVAGALLSGQVAGNGRVAQLTGDPLIPSFTSAAGGTVLLTAVLAVLAPLGQLRDITLPDDPGQWYLYLGGPLGAGITAAAAWVVRHLGTFLLTLALVGGQMATAVVVDLVGDVEVGVPTYAAVAMITAATVLVVLPGRSRPRVDAGPVV